LKRGTPIRFTEESVVIPRPCKAYPHPEARAPAAAARRRRRLT
jgi:hypothetical protein